MLVIAFILVLSCLIPAPAMCAEARQLDYAKMAESPASIFDVDFSLETLADMTGVNSKYVSKVINEAYGCNFRAFINEIRIREAQRRLLDTDRYGSFTIKAIAESVGYKSHANFILLFKKYVGISPSQYQKMATEDKE